MANSFETLLKLTDKFNGLTLLPELYCNDMTPERKMKIKPFQNPVPVREISLVNYRKDTNSFTIKYLESTIKRLMEGRLSSENKKSKDLEIIGL
jgi:LysR family hydrogen peroxide-inducible transcriptional activator